jgi:DNA-binding CsgD family transcriptional regulator
MPALDYAEEQRAAPLAARIREELAMCGARPRNVLRRGADALTPAEARIARLAADGLQNKDIAQRLFLTVGTVQTTLVRVYRKLDVSSRRDIAAALDTKPGPGSAPRMRQRTPAP